MAEARFAPGDTVRLAHGNSAHLMTVETSSGDLVLCAWFGAHGQVHHAPYQAAELELVQRATDRGDTAAA